jgi:hypothetical protein
MVEATPMFLIGGGLMATGCGRVAGSTGPGRVCLSMVSLRLAAPLVLETYTATLLVVNLAKRDISDHTTHLRPLFCSPSSFLLPIVLRVTVEQDGRLSCLAGHTQSTLRHMTALPTQPCTSPVHSCPITPSLPSYIHRMQATPL